MLREGVVERALASLLASPKGVRIPSRAFNSRSASLLATGRGACRARCSCLLMKPISGSQTIRRLRGCISLITASPSTLILASRFNDSPCLDMFSIEGPKSVICVFEMPGPSCSAGWIMPGDAPIGVAAASRIDKYSRMSSSPSDLCALGGASFRLLHSLRFGVLFRLLALPATDPARLRWPSPPNMLTGRDGVVTSPIPCAARGDARRLPISLAATPPRPDPGVRPAPRLRRWTANGLRDGKRP